MVRWMKKKKKKKKKGVVVEYFAPKSLFCRQSDIEIEIVKDMNKVMYLFIGWEGLGL